MCGVIKGLFIYFLEVSTYNSNKQRMKHTTVMLAPRQQQLKETVTSLGSSSYDAESLLYAGST